MNRNYIIEGFPGGSVVKNLSANAGDTGLIPVAEDPSYCRATKPQPQLSSLCSRVLRPQLLKPSCPRACAPQEKLPQ